MLIGNYILGIVGFSCCIYFFLYCFTKICINLNKYLLDIIGVIFLFITILFFYYIYLNIISDFNVLTIKKSSNIFESLFYKISGAWSNHEGSLLLWVWLLSLYTFYTSLSKKIFSQFILKYFTVYQVYFILFFVLFIIFSTNPFLKSKFLILNGMQLNPLLQDFTLSIHPPILYLGYLGYSIIFSYILLNLRLNIINPFFFNKIKYYTLFSWSFLTLGILLGSWWAYYELGWGGWWFWDPVENISLFPWVLTIVFIHIYKLTLRNNNLFYNFNVVGLLLFFIVILGVFFVRSGLLISVHVFALDTTKGYFLFFFLLTLLFFILIHSKHYRFLISNTLKFNYLLFFNVLIFLLLVLLLILGTFLPTVLKLFFNKTLIIGTQYFNEISFTLVCGVLIYFLVNLFQKFNFWFIFQIFSIIFIMFWFSFDLVLFSSYQILVCFFLLLFYCLLFYCYFNKEFSFSSSIHIFFILFILHVLILNWGSFEYFNIFRPGDFLYFLQFFLLFRGINIINSYNYYTLFGNFLLTDWFHLKYIALIFPEKRFYFLEKFAGIKANIVTNYFSDLYLIIGDGQIISGWFIHIIYNPGMPLIWLTGLFIVFFFWYFLIKKNILLKLNSKIILW
jgi:cytochrome c-type biogenesis protein CcmF